MAKLRKAGLTPIEVRHVNAPGLVAWYLGMRVLRGTPRNGQVVRRWDRLVVPPVARLEARWQPPFGQSLFAIARAGPPHPVLLARTGRATHGFRSPRAPRRAPGRVRDDRTHIVVEAVRIPFDRMPVGPDSLVAQAVGPVLQDRLVGGVPGLGGACS